MTLVADFNSSVNVPFQRMRQQQLDGALQEGVVGATDLKVVQRGAGANQSVDVGAGFAWVQIDTGTRNGLGHVTNDASANVTVTASDATNPRIDQIILRWNDTSIPTGSGNVPTLAVLTGTATAGATLDNRTGAAALPNDCLRLADILVPATSTSVTTANIRDRRPWARGAAYLARGNAAGNITTTSTSFVGFATATTDIRLECSGAVLDTLFVCDVSHSVAGSSVQVAFLMDGAGQAIQQQVSSTASAFTGLVVAWSGTPTPGSHLLTWQWLLAGAGTGTMANSAGITYSLTHREILRPNANNS